jgi:hypothetical protein
MQFKKVVEDHREGHAIPTIGKQLSKESAMDIIHGGFRGEGATVGEGERRTRGCCFFIAPR